MASITDLIDNIKTYAVGTPDEMRKMLDPFTGSVLHLVEAYAVCYVAMDLLDLKMEPTTVPFVILGIDAIAPGNYAFDQSRLNRHKTCPETPSGYECPGIIETLRMNRRQDS